MLRSAPRSPPDQKPMQGRVTGLIRLAEIRNAVSIPLIAIGGITLENVQEVIRAGADGIAVISAVVSAPDITEAARTLRMPDRTGKAGERSCPVNPRYGS